MNILFAASEAAPFVKTGGLGDVAQALPQQLEKNENIEIRVVIPYYKSIKENPEFKVNFLTSFGVSLAWRRLHVGVFTAEYKGVTYYLIDNEYYFFRDGCYGFFDDGERFAYFSKAILEMLMHIDFEPDIIHINDWQTSLVPAFLRSQYYQMEKYRKIKTVL
ncbi:MAG: glycogen/starch synthase, partial [Clostridia bacterium]|nr:glycogen/starch synthase [Clostridia bacterium]